MKKILLAATFVALGAASAFAFGPSPSDANPPGALFASRPGGAMRTSQVGMRMTTSDVRLRKHRHHRASMKNNAVGPETGTAKDRASAPAR